MLLVITPARSANAQDTETMIVTANRYPVPVSAMGSAYSLVTGEDMDREQIRIVSDALREVPGVAVSRSGPPGSLTQLRLRGAEANMTLVVIDGVVVNDPGDFDGGFDFANLLAYGIDRIEIIRGAQSAIWGSDAVGGVVNIVTRKGEGPLRAQASGEGGSFGTSTFNVGMSAGGARYDAALTATRYRTNGFSQAEEKLGNREADGSENDNILGRFGFAPTDNLSFAFMGRVTRGQVEFDQPPFDTNDVSKSFQRWVHAEMRLNGFGRHVENIFSGDLLDIVNKTAGSFPTRLAGNKYRFSDQINLTADTNLFARASHHRLSLYAERTRDEGRSSFAGQGEARVTRNTALAGEYALSLADEVFLTAGMRHDANDRFPDATTWRATGAWRVPHLGTRLHASYGTGLKHPTLIELFGFSAGFRGNPDLQSESSKNFDVGLEETFSDGRARVDVTYFDNRIENRIEGAGPVASNVPGTTRIVGLEVEAHAQVFPWLSLGANYTAMDTADPAGNELIRRGRHHGGVDLDAQFLGGKAGLNLGLDYTGRQRDSDFSVFPSRFVDLSPHTLMRLSGRYDLTKRVSLNARVENLLDQDYEDVLFFGTAGISAFGGLTVSVGG
jgi:vitamin B12 transporter